MTKLYKSFAISLGLFAFAAQLPATAQEAAAPTVQADTATGEDLSMGQTAGQADAGATYTKANFDAWEQRCIKDAAGVENCQLYQLLKDAEGTAVAEISLFGLPPGGQAVAGATIIVPLETLLTEGVTLGVDAAQPRIYPFTFCTRVGCIARVGFTAEEVASFKKGAKGVMTIVPAVAPTEKVTVEISLKGFTAGFDAVNTVNDAAKP